MGRPMVTVKHENPDNGTAVVPESAVKNMPGWSVVDDGTATKAPAKKAAAKRTTRTRTPRSKAAAKTGTKSTATSAADTTTPKEKA